VAHVNPGPEGHPSLIILDEGASFFDNRDFKSTKEHQPAIYDFFRQSRKFDLDVILTTADVGDVDKKLRVKCHSVVSFFNMNRVGIGRIRYPFPHILRREYLPTNPPPKGKPNKSPDWIWRDPLVFACYDTKQVLREVVGFNLKRDIHRKPKKVKIMSHSWFKFVRLSHVAIVLFLSLPFVIGCAHKERKALLEDASAVKTLKADLQSAIVQLKTVGISPVSSSSPSSNRSVRLEGDSTNNTFGAETPDGSVIAKGFSVSRNGLACVLLPDGRIIQVGSKFGPYVVLGLTETSINALDLRVGKPVSVPLACYF
jgi:hypothetical protein